MFGRASNLDLAVVQKSCADRRCDVRMALAELGTALAGLIWWGPTFNTGSLTISRCSELFAALTPTLMSQSGRSERVH